jgi:hypothetical protein
MTDRLKDEIPEPCTEEAYELGCTCQMRPSPIPRGEYAPLDPPEPRISRDCPVHGAPEDDRDRFEYETR